jgi:hypothetical protein
MSTEGAGAVVIGAAIAAPIALAAFVAVGAGILVAQGVMWCGKKMEENYNNACKEWTDLYEAAQAKSRANVDDIPMLLAGQAERIAAYSASLSLNPATVESSDTVAQKALVDSMAKVRRALENTQDTLQVQADTERELLVYRLKSEIEASRGILPSEKIALAEAALQGSSTEIQNALNMLQLAWKTITNVQAMSTHQDRRVRQLLHEVTAQLTAIDTMLRNAGRSQAYTTRKQDIANRLREAENVLDTHPADALALAEDAQKAARALARTVSVETLSAWDQTRRKVLTLQGTLETLAKMTREAVTLKLIEAQQAGDITRRISVAQSEARTLVQGASATTPQRLLLLNERVELLKEDVFRVMKTKQQNMIAQTVATTLGELGFQAALEGETMVQENGDMLRVVVARSGGTPNFKQDDKVVSFDISRNGDLSYDFSGYIGDTCLSEAKEIFAALRVKGVFILDSSVQEMLSKLPAESITADTLREAKYSLEFVKNKTQTELAERLKQVLEQMNFANIEQSVIGGCIDLEAFNGSIGYHVILPPDGSAQVFKNHKDISSDKGDRVVARALELFREPEPERKQESQETETQKKTQTTHSDMHKRQILGQ